MWWTRRSLIAIAMMLGAASSLAVADLSGGPALLGSDPVADGTLCKTANNVLLLTFDGPIALPDGGAPALSIFGGWYEEGDAFTCSVELDGVTLRAVEQGPMLTDQTWYRIAPGVGFVVQVFGFDVCTLFGDANNSGRVTTADYSEVKAHLGEHTDARYDLNGSGRMTTADYSIVKAHLGSRKPDKPLPDMVPVPGGQFEMGDPWDEGETNELPVHSVYLSPYYIDTYQVTNQQYAAALNWAWHQGGLIEVTGGVVYKYGSGTTYPYCDTYTADSDSRIHWNDSTFTVTTGKENHPMVEMSWYGAVAYCNWRSAIESKPLCYDLSTWECNWGSGYRLPTEAEWEKAAGWDPAQQRHYRFGEHTDGCGYDCLDGQRANYRYSGDPYDAGSYPWTTPVGFYNGALHHKIDFDWPGSQTSYQTQNAQSYYGCYDMSGNVFEWCHDWYSITYYSSSPSSNPTGPGAGAYRVLRGGYWYDNPYRCSSATRIGSTPVGCNHYNGFRCAVGIP